MRPKAGLFRGQRPELVNIEGIMEQRWCIGNRKTNKVEKNLYPNQVAQRVLDQTKDGYSENDWVVWTTGWAGWKPLTEIQELIYEISLLKKMNEEFPPPIGEAPPMTLDISENNAEAEKIKSNKAAWEQRKPETVEVQSLPEAAPVVIANTETTQNEPTNLANKRKHKRITTRLRCIIRSTSLTFRTFTLDISLGGVGLEDEIPSELIGKECMIYLTSPKAKRNLKFKVSMTSRSVAKYFSFQEADPEFLEELQRWLDDLDEAKAA